MHKTRRLMDEVSVSFQMFSILLSFIKFCSRKPHFCVQAMSEQYRAMSVVVVFLCGGACAEAKIWR